MKKVIVEASKKYEVLIGHDLISRAGEKIAGVCTGRRAVIVTDSNVGKYYAGDLAASLDDAGIDNSTFVFEAGEENKTGETLFEILRSIADRKLTRQDLVVALGGGVTGDMAGLAAALYMRGIDYVQIPTSILAAVDSSVGGKTAVDLPQGKNLAGAFYQPSLVIIDTNVFKTLPERDFRSGFAEIIKYAMISDPQILDLAGSCIGPGSGRGEEMEDLIARCVSIKADVVKRDEFEQGERRLLNFGHTIGHALEKASDFSLLHGEAVAIGMAMITEASAKEGACDSETCEGLKQALFDCGLPRSIEEMPETAGALSREKILEHISLDKKNDDDGIYVVLPEKIGKCVIEKMSPERMGEFL